MTGIGRVVRIEGSMNAAKYREDLEINLQIVDLRPVRRFTFQHNSVSKHTAKMMFEWFQDKPMNVLEWPSQS